MGSIEWKVWRKQALEPALLARLDTAFPEFDFHRHGAYWSARTSPAGYENWGAREQKLDASGKGFKTWKGGGQYTSWVDYLMAREGLRFIDALKKLADLAGVPFPSMSAEQVQAMTEREAKRRLLSDFFTLAHTLLLSDSKEAKEARAYLGRRGFREDELDALPLGLCPTIKAAEDALLGKGHLREGLLSIYRGAPKGTTWEGRLVGCARSLFGEVENLWARDMTGTAEEGSKYLYLMNPDKGGAALVKKGELHALGLDVALENGGRERLVLVEGVLDAVHLHARGLLNVAALGDAAPTVERMRAFRGMGVKRLVLALDNDPTGHRNTAKAVEDWLKAQSPAAKLPDLWIVDPAGLGDAKDPDEWMRKNGENADAFARLIHSAKEAALVRADELLAKVLPGASELERREAVQNAIELAEGLRGPWADLAREAVLKEVQARTGITAPALQDAADARAEARRKEAQERDLAALLREAQAKQSAKAGAHEVLDLLHGGLSSIRSTAQEVPPAFSVDRIVERIESAQAGRLSGWATLDKSEEDGGLGIRFNPGELALFGARTGHAKTSAMVGLLWNWLRQERDERLVFYSMEESEAAIFRRLVALGTESVDSRTVEARLKAGQRKAVGPALDLLRRWEDRLLIVHRPAWSAEAIRDHALGLDNVGGVLVDYLQRIPDARGGRYGTRRDLEVSAAARVLKSMAEELQAPVVTGAQINRETAGNANLSPADSFTTPASLKELRKGRPDLHNLRDGGSEQEVDLALGLLNLAADFRTDDPAKRPEGPTPLDVGTLKNRYGTSGVWRTLAFEGRRHLIRDATPQELGGWR